MMKKTLASVLAVCMLLSVIGSFAIFGMSASAAPNYYEFVQLPGFTVWTNEELAMHDCATLGYTSAPVHSTDSLPAGVDDAIKYTITKLTSDWRAVKINTSYTRNFKTSPDAGIEWGAKSKINGKDLVGDVDLSGYDGIAFWVGTDGGAYTGKFKIQLFLSESKGTFYNGTDDGLNDLDDAPVGFLYESDTKYADEEGYFYFDFDTEFRQVDWWSTDDDGVSQSVYDIGEVNTPLPEKVITSFDGIQLITSDIPVGTNVYLADFKGYKDTRVFIDALEEAVFRFDSLNAEAYTETSYNVASEVYITAMDVLLEGAEAHTQYEIDCMAARLNNAIDALDKLFPIEAETKVNGFGVWDESDFEIMADGGYCRDLAFIDDSKVLGNDDYSIGVISTATMGPPDYGWSRFISVIEGDDGEEAVKNPFGADLNDTSGIKFLISYMDGYRPSGFQIGVGVAGEVYFVANEPGVVYPENEESGTVYVPWVEFYDYNGEADIYEYLDRLDYIEISIPEASQVQYNISDLQAFVWGISDADFSGFEETVESAEALIASKEETSYYPDTWEDFVDAYTVLKGLNEKYGVTNDDIAAAVAAFEAASEALLPIEEGVEYELLAELYNNYKSVRKLWGGNYNLASSNKVKKAVENYEKVKGTAITAEKAAELNNAIIAAFDSLKEITFKTEKEGIVSFEDFGEYDLDYCAAKRSPGVYYSIGESEDLGAMALKMKATRDIVANGGVSMSFYPFLTDYLTRPLYKGDLVGNISGINGFMFDVAVNDSSLGDDVTLNFGVINKNAASPFNKSATGIKLPASGCGRIYIPTYCLTQNNEFTNSIDFSNIEAYYFEVCGDVKREFEISISNVSAYVGNTTAVPEAAVISGVDEGETYYAGIAPTWSTGVAQLDGKDYDHGEPIIYNGEHTLVVISGQNRTSVTFNIIDGIDAETAKKGDFDDDGVITVSDALAALRIAAKLAESTSAALKIGDIDSDGVITVSDALAILRVAAKMSDSL